MPGKGPALRICQRTGFKVPASEMVREWTGLWVWRPYWEPKHPSLDFQAPRGERVKRDATGPENDNDLGDTNPPPDPEQLGANN